MMSFDLATYHRLSAKLDVEDIDFDFFRERPLAADALRCLRYMHDVESHTVCYLRDVLVTRAHRDPELTSFLTLWNYEEFWHGEAIAKVLEAARATSRRVHPDRRTSPASTEGRPVEPLTFQLASAITPHLTARAHDLGAVNEWTTQAAYARLAKARRPPHAYPDLLRRIMKQEGRHIDFYSTQAKSAGHSRAAQTGHPMGTQRFWAPGRHRRGPRTRRSIFARLPVRRHRRKAVAARIDRRIDSLPGLNGLHLLGRTVALATVAVD